MDQSIAISNERGALELLQELEEYASGLYGDSGEDALIHLRAAGREIRAAGRALRAAEAEE